MSMAPNLRWNKWPWVKIQIVPPVNIPIPTKIGSKMGGAPTPNGIPLVLTTTAKSHPPLFHHPMAFLFSRPIKTQNGGLPLSPGVSFLCCSRGSPRSRALAPLIGSGTRMPVTLGAPATLGIWASFLVVDFQGEEFHERNGFSLVVDQLPSNWWFGLVWCGD